MDSIARVSAVFLLVGAVWVAGVLGAEVDAGVTLEPGPIRLRMWGSEPRWVSKAGRIQVCAMNPSGAQERRLRFSGRLRRDGGQALRSPSRSTSGREGEAGFWGGGTARRALCEKSGLLSHRGLSQGHADNRPWHQQDTDGVQGKTRPYALLERVYRDRNGLSRKEVVFVSLALEDGQWAISEIRAIPPSSSSPQLKQTAR